MFQSGLGRDSDGIRLRATIINHLYRDGLCPTDVLSLLIDIQECDEEPPFGLLWNLTGTIPAADACAILDGLNAEGLPRSKPHIRWEIAGTVGRLLLQVLRSHISVTGKQLWKWLQDRRAARDFYSGNVDDLRNELLRRQDLHPRLIHAALGLALDKQIFSFISRFREVTLGAVDEDEIIEAVEKRFCNAEPGSQREAFLYQVEFISPIEPQQEAVAIFERLYAAGDTRLDLAMVRKQASVPMSRNTPSA